ncbi:MAG: cytochrome c biogenesis CcdA family protein [Micromonosporaceae bacterium]
MRELLLSTTVLASFLGGVVALLAPCCVSVMLPAYMASAFRRRSRILGMTVVFAAGVATMILPVALGATALSRLFIGQHAWIYTIGGTVMVAFGVALLAGWRFSLPMPGMRTPGSTGIFSVYSLGAFSGVASACCAPVLAGVIAASGAVSSFPAALAVGVAYVFGMVAPLALLATIWDRRRWDVSRLVNRRVRLHLGPLRRELPLGTVVSGALLVAMGLLTIGLAAAGPGMSSGWQSRLAGWLDHLRAVVLDELRWLPGWLTAGLVFVALAAVLLLAWRQQRGRLAAPSDEKPAPGELADAESTPGADATEATAAAPAATTDLETTR